MGLDILAFEKVTLTKEHDDEDEDGNWCGDKDNHYTIYSDSEFVARLGSLKQGRCYETSGEEMHFRAGSYSGYNEWREALSIDALGVPPSALWERPEQWVICPFFELINMSDCEGAIGPEVARKLARDFQLQRDTVRPRLAARGEWYALQYDNWQRAFELAAKEGMVRFC